MMNNILVFEYPNRFLKFKAEEIILELQDFTFQEHYIKLQKPKPKRSQGITCVFYSVGWQGG